MIEVLLPIFVVFIHSQLLSLTMYVCMYLSAKVEVCMYVLICHIKIFTSYYNKYRMLYSTYFKVKNVKGKHP